jgi:hypothetical protein
MPIYLSLGELCDRLCIVANKQWHLEEQMSDPNVSDETKVEITDQIVNLNAFRMRLIAAINEHSKDKEE